MLFKSNFTIKFILLVVIFIFLINFFSFSNKIQNFFYNISFPVQKNFWSAGINFLDFYNNIFNIEKIKQENRDLKQRVNELEVININSFQIEQENKFLRQALNINLSKDFDLILSDVVSKNYSQDSILINKGKKHGIEVGFPVIAQEKVLVGKVEEVYENFSKVMLVSNKRNNFNVEIISGNWKDFISFPIFMIKEKFNSSNSSNSILCKATGKGNFKIELDLIPKEKEISKGDLIITTLLGDVLPKGLLVGHIIEVENVPTDPFWKVDLKLSFNLDDLRHVFVIKNEL